MRERNREREKERERERESERERERDQSTDGKLMASTRKPGALARQPTKSAPPWQYSVRRKQFCTFVTWCCRG